MSGEQTDFGFGSPEEREGSGPVECLGMRFANEVARREYFTEKLREKLQDPEFRATPGFPLGEDEDILRLSDPPYYTACPNPFLADFARHNGKAHDPDEPYEREPFAVDVRVGKTDQLYRAHAYHTKVPHLAIVPSILHYTEPGDLVLDGFCGSGMTGLAAQWCGTAPATYRKQLESEWKAAGREPPKWGARTAVLNDLGPAATFIAAGYNLPFDVAAFEREAKRILAELEEEIGWMYETLHTDGKTKGRINYTVWSEIFSCPECAGEVNFMKEALDQEAGRTLNEFPCPHCGAEVAKKRLERFYITRLDEASGGSIKAPKRAPELINYNVDGQTYEKSPTQADLDLIKRCESLALPKEIPIVPIPYMHMTHERARMDSAGVKHINHFFLARASQSMTALWRRANNCGNPDTRRMLIWLVEQAIASMSLLNRYKPLQHGRVGGSQVNNQMSGIYYIASLVPECSPWYVLHDSAKRSTKLLRINKAFRSRIAQWGSVTTATGDCAALGLPDHTVDYVFTDPPFGENIYYADLNFLVESWHRVFTNADHEAIIDKAKKKGLHEYQELMRQCFVEYHRVLKPGRWMTVVFSNSSNAVWRAIQEAMGTAGFVVADVRTLDKKQGSYRQVTSSAVKQDLIISAYKPTAALTQRFALGHADPESAWAFIAEHLGNVAKIPEAGEIIAERMPQMLLDRMTAFHVQRGVAVPLSVPDFLQGLAQRFPDRDGMHFLPEQIAEYEAKRDTVAELHQIPLFVKDEATAIQWIRQKLQEKPQTFPELQPQFMREIHGWAKHEQTVELRDLLEQSFLCYDGRGPVPSQVHSYLSSNYKELRNREKDDPVLVKKAKDRWYVANPKKQADLEQLRERALLREFEAHRASKEKRLKQFRTEAIRAGFKAAYATGDYETILDVAKKIPEKILQEDEKLLMYFDVASMRSSTD